MFTRLLPGLCVADVLAERRFYESLGFDVYVDEQESYAEDAFAALAYGDAIRFGFMHDPGFDVRSADARLAWQLGTSAIEDVYERALRASLSIEQPPKLEPWGRQTLKLRSPNGYLVTFEEDD